MTKEPLYQDPCPECKKKAIYKTQENLYICKNCKETYTHLSPFQHLTLRQIINKQNTIINKYEKIVKTLKEMKLE